MLTTVILCHLISLCSIPAMFPMSLGIVLRGLVPEPQRVSACASASVARRYRACRGAYDTETRTRGGTKILAEDQEAPAKRPVSRCRREPYEAEHEPVGGLESRLAMDGTSCYRLA
jgi:hypothetical protein